MKIKHDYVIGNYSMGPRLSALLRFGLSKSDLI